ncbi:MAG: hypothetical protein ABI042_15830 [Verrucomicrobiota bacterium]
MANSLQKKFGQSSWRIATREVEACVTETGGHLGPITFRIRKKKIQPFAIAPWAEEKIPKNLPAVLKVLQGDFFAMPFGGNETAFKGEHHLPHGETANAKWKCESIGADNLHLSLKTKVRSGRVDKHIFLRAGHTAVYQRHIITNMKGAMSLGHHAMLQFPTAAGSGRLSTSRFLRGHVAPLPLENSADLGRSFLKSGSVFRSLEKVPTQNGDWTDLSIYPARRGFDDLVLLEADIRQPLAWTAVTFPTKGYVWFALKDPRVLRQTILWMSNGGRRYAPWNRRHINVIGLEEVTSYFHYGLAESAKRNSLTTNGAQTCHHLQTKKPLVVNYIMAVAAIPSRFDRVAKILPASDKQSVRLISQSGKSVNVLLALEFLGEIGAQASRMRVSILSDSTTRRRDACAPKDCAPIKT